MRFRSIALAAPIVALLPAVSLAQERVSVAASLDSAHVGGAPDNPENPAEWIDPAIR